MSSTEILLKLFKSNNEILGLITNKRKKVPIVAEAAEKR